MVLGYGINGVIAEYASNGTLLCDARFEPSYDFTSGNVQSFRNLKFNWTGLPKTSPNLVRENGILYVSWLGATEVRSWLFEDSDDGKRDWRRNEVVEKHGFETHYSVPGGKSVRQYVRAVALDASGRHLATSEVLETKNMATDVGNSNDAAHHDPDEAGAGSGDNNVAEEDHEEVHLADDENGSEATTGPTDSKPANEQHEEEIDDTADGDHTSDELLDELEDMQVLLVLGFLAVLSGCAVAWMRYGRRWSWGKIPQDEDEDEDEEAGGMAKMRFIAGSGSFWQRLRSWRPRRGGAYGLLGGWRRREEDEGMLSDVELSDTE